MPSKKWAWFWLAVGVLLFAVDILWFQFKAFGIHFPIGVLAALYGAMILIWHRGIDQGLKLTPDDLASYGAALERSVSVIMDMLEQKRSAKEIAHHVQREQGVPPEITYKYIIALGAEMKERSAEPENTTEDT